MALEVKNVPVNVASMRHSGSIPGWGISPGGGHGNSFWYSCLKNPLDRGLWRALVLRVTKSWTRLKQLSLHACRLPTTLLRKILNPQFSSEEVL